MNPLFQAMGGMMPTLPPAVQMVAKLMSGRNPQEVFEEMVQQNPQFRQFVEQNKGKTPEQVAKEHGIDLSRFKNMM